jgi:TolB protein
VFCIFGVERTGLVMNLTAVVANALLLAAPERATPGDLAFLRLTDGVWQVWTMRADGSDQRQVTRSAFDKMRASWYPDGRLLVSASDGSAYRVEATDGREARIPLTLSGFQDAVVAPDGSRIAFSLATSSSVDDHDIWLVDERGAQARKLTSMPGLQHEPSWSVDGQYVYFLSGSGGQTHDIWRVSVSNLHAEQITANQLYHFDVAVDARGDLAFSSNRSGSYEIWIRRAAGEDRQLTRDTALDAHPSWSPDGSEIAFESTRGGKPAIWIIHLASGQSEQLGDDLAPSRFPVWRGTSDVR